jgi:hypothetical protein
MLDPLEIIRNILAQHFTITENIKTTGDRMNDIDAVFSIQVASYQTAQSAYSVSNLLEKRIHLLNTINILEDGLKKHFTYEERVMPLVLGDLLLEDILHDHKKITGQIENVKASLINLEKLNKDEIQSKRLELVENVNNLRDIIVNHTHFEEEILGVIKKVFENKPVHPN